MKNKFLWKYLWNIYNRQTPEVQIPKLMNTMTFSALTNGDSSPDMASMEDTVTKGWGVSNEHLGQHKAVMDWRHGPVQHSHLLYTGTPL